jgi:hypothetical protein
LEDNNPAITTMPEQAPPPPPPPAVSPQPGTPIQGKRSPTISIASVVVIILVIGAAAYYLTSGHSSSNNDLIYAQFLKSYVSKSPLNLTAFQPISTEKLKSLPQFYLNYSGKIVVSSNSTLLGGLTLSIPFTAGYEKYDNDSRATLNLKDVPLFGNLSIIAINSSSGIYSCTSNATSLLGLYTRPPGYTCTKTNTSEFSSLINATTSFSSNIVVDSLSLQSYQKQSCLLTTMTGTVSPGSKQHLSNISSTLGSLAGSVSTIDMNFTGCYSTDYYVPFNLSGVASSSNTSITVTLHETGIGTQINQTKVTTLPGPIVNATVIPTSSSAPSSTSSSTPISLKASPGGCQVYRPNGPGSTTYINTEGVCDNGSPQYVAQFNRQSSYVSTAPVPSGPLQTISVWVYPKQTNQSSYGSGVGGTILESNQNGNFSGYALGIQNSGKVWWWPQPGQDRYSTGTVPLNTWTNIVLAYNKTKANIYLNGVLDSSQTASPPNPASFTKIGAKSWITGNFSGLMANLQIYNTTLTSPQIAALYSGGIGADPEFLNNLVGWWPLNGNANDYSGNLNNGLSTALSYVSNYNYTEASYGGGSTNTASGPAPPSTNLNTCIASPGFTCQIVSYDSLSNQLGVTIYQNSGTEWVNATFVYVNEPQEASVLSSGLSEQLLASQPIYNKLPSLASGTKQLLLFSASSPGYIWVSYSTASSGGSTIQAQIASVS